MVRVILPWLCLALAGLGCNSSLDPVAHGASCRAAAAYTRQARPLFTDLFQDQAKEPLRPKPFTDPSPIKQKIDALQQTLVGFVRQCTKDPSNYTGDVGVAIDRAWGMFPDGPEKLDEADRRFQEIADAIADPER